MLRITTNVNKGILFIRLEGQLDKSNYKSLENEINYLLYKQGMHYFVINFDEINIEDKNLLLKIQSKLIEIFLSCGKVALCGLTDERKKQIGKTKDNLYYIKNEIDAFKYLYL